MSEFELQPLGRRNWKVSLVLGLLIAVSGSIVGWISTGNLERKMRRRAHAHCLKSLPEKECDARLELLAQDCFDEHYDRDVDRISVDDYLRCVLAHPEATPDAGGH